MFHDMAGLAGGSGVLAPLAGLPGLGDGLGVWQAASGCHFAARFHPEICCWAC